MVRGISVSLTPLLEGSGSHASPTLWGPAQSLAKKRCQFMGVIETKYTYRTYRIGEEDKGMWGRLLGAGGS